MSESSKIPVLVMLFFVMVVQILALAITPAISASGNRVFEDPTSIANPFAYMLLILVFTGLLLLAMRLKRGWIISVFILLSIAVSIYYVMAAFMSPLLALVPTLAIMLLLHFYPEWYIIDAFGILVCAGISSLFGVSMTIPPTLLLLVVLAVYDAISVYKTRHMISLAEGAIKMKAPLLFVVPKSRDYSFRIDQEISNSPEDTTKRGAFFLGLGDAIIPTILVISASWSLPAGGFYGLSLPVLGAMLGTYLGFLLLMTTSRDRPQAGLPFLNSGVILGFLMGCLAAGVRPI
jgi:presenilin-like A22 family membrane protease